MIQTNSFKMPVVIEEGSKGKRFSQNLQMISPRTDESEDDVLNW
jgi:hypothetical protein